MPLAKCIRDCWDSQLTKQYFKGNIVDLPADHVFLIGKTRCFELIKAEDIPQSKDDMQSKVNQLSELILKQQKEIAELRKIRPDELISETKRPVGRPRNNPQE